MQQGDAPVSWLMFFTFAATILVIAGAFIAFLRSRHNRDIAQSALAGSDHPRVNRGTDGALPDLLGITMFAFIAMGLLSVGYHYKPFEERAEVPAMVGQTNQTTGSFGSR